MDDTSCVVAEIMEWTAPWAQPGLRHLSLFPAILCCGVVYVMNQEAHQKLYARESEPLHWMNLWSSGSFGAGLGSPC